MFWKHNKIENNKEQSRQYCHTFYILMKLSLKMYFISLVIHIASPFSVL